MKDSTLKIELNNLKFIDGDFLKSENWIENIYEHDEFTRKSELITFECNGVEVIVSFDLSVSGRVEHDPGDYWTPPYTDVDITDVDVSVNQLFIDDNEFELTKEIKSTLEQEIKKYL